MEINGQQCKFFKDKERIAKYIAARGKMLRWTKRGTYQLDINKYYNDSFDIHWKKHRNLNESKQDYYNRAILCIANGNIDIPSYYIEDAFGHLVVSYLCNINRKYSGYMMTKDGMKKTVFSLKDGIITHY